MEFKKELPQELNIYGFTNDFKENMGLVGLRVSAPIKETLHWEFHLLMIEINI